MGRYCMLLWLACLLHVACEAVNDPPDGDPPTTEPDTTTTQTTTMPLFCASVDGRTCHLKEDTKSWQSNQVTWDGDLVFPQGKDIHWSIPPLAIYRAVLEFRVSGDIFLRYAARLNATTGVIIWSGGFVCEGCHLQAPLLGILLNDCKSNCSKRVSISDGTILVSRGLTIKSTSGIVNITGETYIQVSGRAASATKKRRSMTMIANKLLLEDKTVLLEAELIDLYAYSQLIMAATPDAESNLSNLLLRSAGFLKMSPGHGFGWSVSSLVAMASTMSLEPDHRIEVKKTSDNCGFRRADASNNLCKRMVDVVPDKMGRLEVLDTVLSRMSLELVLVAEKDLVMGASSKLLAGAAMLCAGTKLEMKQSVKVWSIGRGCRPGKGRGQGETRSHWTQCGGGGASNLGLGGEGANGLATGDHNLERCSKPGERDFFHRPFLPLDGAGGGGCGMKVENCINMTQQSGKRYGSGGGLIWLSAPELRLEGDVRVSSDGVAGGFDPNGGFHTSGAGAGGQIIVFTDSLTVPSTAADTGLPRLSARGGDAQCSSQSRSIGGAGGGGFIGLQSQSKGTDQSPVSDPKRLLLDVSGGTVTETCANFLPQKFQASILGGPGLATTLTACPPGMAGPFCKPCPAGQWGDGGGSCQDCTKKLPRTGIYTTQGWPNASCPFECVPGLPPVQINPDCLDNIDFAVSFFGGKLGFLLIVCCPLMLFVGIRYVHRFKQQQKRRPSSWNPGAMSRDDGKAPDFDGGLWSFPPERLPLHVRRIFLQGYNSPECPWTLPGTGGEANCAALISAIPETMQPTIREDSWAELAKELAKATRPPRKEKWSLWLLWCACPPLCELVAWLWRRRRARAAERQLRAFNHGLLGRGLWKDAAGGPQPSLRFGCDDKATVAYLDLFDLSRSPLDWVPADLRKSEQRFVAAGHGTWANPFELVVSDPLFQGLAQTLGQSGMSGAQGLFSLLCTFNLFSRLLPATELEAASVAAANGSNLGDSKSTPALCTLIHEVEQCSRQYGLRGAVEVQLASVARSKAAQSNGTGPGRQSAAQELLMNSFTDLVRQLPAEEGALPKAGKATEPREDLKLCLVFSGKGSAGEGAFISVSDILSTPRDAFSPLSPAPHAAEEARGLQTKIHSALMRLRCKALLPWTCTAKNLHMSYIILALFFFTMILLNAMVCVVMAFSLCRVSSSPYVALFTWLLLPTPFAPILSPCIGFSALLLKEAAWGRVHAEIAFRSFTNALLTSIAFYQLELVLPLGMALLFDALVGAFAAAYAGLEMSSEDLATADDSVGTSLNLQVNASSRYFPRPSVAAQRPSEISMTVLPSAGTPSNRLRGDSCESEVGNSEAATPF